MNIKIIHIVFLSLIIIIGTILRFYNLGQVPNSLNWDEASWGYNAYSLLTIGRDEYGQPFPLSFKAFGDYKQPIYVYITMVSIAMFDLTPFAVRFPSAFLGSLSILFVFLLVYELFKKDTNGKVVALLAALLFAVSPWSIQFSRIAYEANVGLFFVIMGVWLFMKSLNEKNKWYLFLSSLPLALSAYTYHSEKLFTPLLVLVLIVASYLAKRIDKKTLLVFFALYSLLNIFWIVDTRTTARGRSVTLFSHQTELLDRTLKQQSDDVVSGDTVGSLLHNRRLIFANKYLENYLKHFDPNYLFIKADGNSSHHAPGMGLLYIALSPFMFYGAIRLLRKRSFSVFIVFTWLILAPVASAFAYNSPNPSRSLIFLPTWHIFEAIGLFAVYELVKNRNRMKFILMLVIILFAMNVTYYLHQYFIHLNPEYERYWQYGYKQAVEFTNKNKDKRVVFSSRFEQPYIFYLLYSKYHSGDYTAAGGSNRIWQKCFNIDNVYFGKCEDKIEKGTMVLLFPQEQLTSSKELQTIKFTTGEDAFKIVEKL